MATTNNNDKAVTLTKKLKRFILNNKLKDIGFNMDDILTTINKVRKANKKHKFNNQEIFKAVFKKLGMNYRSDDVTNLISSSGTKGIKTNFSDEFILDIALRRYYDVNATTPQKKYSFVAYTIKSLRANNAYDIFRQLIGHNRSVYETLFNAIYDNNSLIIQLPFTQVEQKYIQIINKDSNKLTVEEQAFLDNNRHLSYLNNYYPTATMKTITVTPQGYSTNSIGNSIISLS